MSQVNDTDNPAVSGDSGSQARGRRSRLGERVLIGLVISYAAVLLAGPLVAMVWSSLAKGAGEFLRQITASDAISSLNLTLLLALAATAINTVFGLCVAWILVRDRFPGQRIINGLVDLPFAVSPVIAGFMLILLFGRGGWLTPLTDWLGIKVVFALPGMLIATTFISLPFVIREVMPVLSHLGVEQENAAYTLGAGKLQTFWHVTLPAVRWGLLYGVSLTFARAVGEIGAVLIISGSITHLTETSTLYIFRSLDDRNYVGGYAMAVVLAVITFVILMSMESLKKRSDKTQ